MTLKDLIQDFNKLFTAPKTVSNTYTQVAWAQSCANYIQHMVPIICNMLWATWYVRTAQLLSLTGLKSHLFPLNIVGWTINRWRRGGDQSTLRKPWRPASENATY